MTNQPLPPPGWYPDPGDHNAWRWWSGTSWTQHTSARASQRPTTATRDLQEQELQIERLALYAALVVAAAAIGLGLFEWFNGKSLANALHAMRVGFERSENGQDADFGTSINISNWNYLFTLFSLMAQAQLIVWQYRAARVAQQLGYRARYTPGFGAASWIIPFVNFVVPYRAVRDLLPQDHPTSRIVECWWITYLIGLAASFGLFFAAGEARGIGAILLALVIVDNVARCIFQRAIIMEVGRCHRSLLGHT